MQQRYFSPVELGDERYTNKLYFQTESRSVEPSKAE